MKPARIIIVACLTAIAPVSSRAADCREMRQSFEMEEMWICRLAYNDGLRGFSRTSCFMDEASGVAWLGARSSGVKGQIYKANCMHRGRMMMDWIRTDVFRD